MTLILNIIGVLIYGLIILFSASWYISANVYQNAYFFLLKQSVWIVTGLVLLFVLSKIDYKKWKEFASWLLGIATVFLIAVLFIGIPICGAKRWLYIGSIGFQTGELAKFVFVIFLALYFSNLSEEKKNFLRTFLYP